MRISGHFLDKKGGQFRPPKLWAEEDTGVITNPGPRRDGDQEPIGRKPRKHGRSGRARGGVWHAGRGCKNCAGGRSGWAAQTGAKWIGVWGKSRGSQGHGRQAPRWASPEHPAKGNSRGAQVGPSRHRAAHPRPPGGPPRPGRKAGWPRGHANRKRGGSNTSTPPCVS